MSQKYFLPCRCGQQHVVERQHAGESITCSCGEVLQIPALLEMTALEIAPDKDESLRVAWGWKQRMVFLGIVILLAAIGLGIIVIRHKPIPPIDRIDPERIQERANELSPLNSWGVWEGLKRQGLGRTDTRFADSMLNYHIWLAASVIFALSGVVLIAIGLAPDKSKLHAPRR